MPSPYRPSHTQSLAEASFSTSPDRALALLIERGALILDDDLQNLKAVASVCTDFLGIPETRVACVHARQGMSLHEIIEQTENHLRSNISSTGTSFAGIITDFKLSPSINSLEVWRAVDASFSNTSYQTPWRQTGRVLMTATLGEIAIKEAQTTGLIDSLIHKPFSLSQLENALITSIQARIG